MVTERVQAFVESEYQTQVKAYKMKFNDNDGTPGKKQVGSQLAQQVSEESKGSHAKEVISSYQLSKGARGQFGAGSRKEVDQDELASGLYQLGDIAKKAAQSESKQSQGKHTY